MIHYVLQKQCCSDDDNFDLPLIYHVNGHSLHFGRRYDVKINDLFALFDDEEKFSKLSDEDAIRLCLLLSLEVIFMGRELVSLVDDVYLRMVNDLEAWNSFPWDMDNRVFLYIGSLVDQSAKNHTESTVMEEKARAAKKKSSEDFHPSKYVQEASLIDRVRELECICETLLTLPKEVKSSRGRIHKLESIIQSTFHPSRVIEKQETLKKVISQIEDYLHSTSENEPDIKDHTSPKEDDGNVYCFDDNGDVLLFFMPAKLVSQQTDQDLSSDLSMLNGFCNLSQTREEKGDCEVFFSRAVVGRCKFHWCNDITVDRSFWNGLCALDDNRKGWLLDEHINLWVTYLWLTRKTDMDWAIVSSYFLPLLLQWSMPLIYANNDISSIPWSNVER
nr:phospholipase-like, aminotransferase-like mobile domain protein [Tanacetum cinerariifolium]